ncbi:hypothetical protein ACH498_25155 [Rhodococcus erythropolis]
MDSREIAVTVGEGDWLTLHQAADAAGMSVEAYVSWGVRILAMQARPGGTGHRECSAGPLPRRDDASGEESEAAAWAETFHPATVAPRRPSPRNRDLNQLGAEVNRDAVGLSRASAPARRVAARDV